MLRNSVEECLRLNPSSEMTRLNELTLIEALKGLKERRFSAVELTSTCLKRIEEVDSKVRAYITVCPDEALAEAKKADVLLATRKGEAFSKYPLCGIPVAVKDIFCTKGIKTTAASRILENYVPVYDATVVRKLKDAGAVILGKTNMDAFAHGSSTEASDFFTTHNPWDLNRLPGGSSGGSAAAIAADETVFAIGSETAGSIRQPAAWCGIVGLKPTYGRVSRYGVIAMASSLDSPGPMTKRVSDAALVLQVLAGKDDLDATTPPQEVPQYSVGIDRGIRGLRVGVPKEYFVPGIQKEVAEKVREAIKILGKLGAKVTEISLLDPKYAVAPYAILQRAEVSSNLARFDGIRYGNPRSAFGDEAKRRMMFGTYILSAGYYEAYYERAQKVRTLICEDFSRAFEKVDAIVGPTSPSVALSIGASEESAMFGELQDVLVEASSLAGLPGLNVCCGITPEGLPVGMQIIGPRFAEAEVLRVGAAYEQETRWQKQRPFLKKRSK